MSGVVYSATLDGVSNFTFHGNNYGWGNGYLSSIDEWGGDGPVVNTFSLTLMGNWDIGNLHLGGWAVTNIMDATDGISRNIETLRLSGFGGTVHLTTTRVEVLKVYNINGQPGPVDLTLGSAGAGAIILGNSNDTVRGGDGNIDSVRLSDGNNLFVGGSGSVESVQFYGGNDTVRGGSGFIDAVSLGSGNNLFIGGSGDIGTIVAHGGNDTVVLQGSADAINLSSGNNKVTTGVGFVGAITYYGNDGDVDSVTVGTGGVRSIGLSDGKDTVTILAGANADQVQTQSNDDTVVLKANATIGSLDLGGDNNTLTLADGARITSVTAGNGNDTVTLNGSSRVFLLKVDGGDNIITTDTGNVESIYSYGGNNTLNIGLGGVQQIVLSGDGTHHITSAGFIGSLQCYDNSTTTAVLNGGSINVSTGRGNDHITTGDNSWTVQISTWDGDDTITMGANAHLEFARMGVGNDTLMLNTPFAGTSIVANGGDGTDLIDFTQMTAGVTISMNLNGAYQALGAGKVSITEFENLTGTSLNDNLEGNDAANILMGLGGNDHLSSLAGADTLWGGKGNDVLTGGADADVFEFVAAGGRDHVTDFTLHEDHLQFAGTHKLADITFAAQAGGVLLTVGTTSVVMDGMTLAQMHDAANFLF